MERLAPVDAAWYRMEFKNSPSDIVGLFLFEGEVDGARLRERIEQRLLSHRHFGQRVSESRLRLSPPRWQAEAKRAVHDHFADERLPPPGSESQLTAVVERLVNRTFDASHSPWRMVLIHGFSGGSVLLAQLHHCMGDGFQLVQIILSLADDESVLASPQRTAAGSPRPKRSALRHARALLRGCADVAYLLRLPFDPSTGFRGPLSGERRLAWTSGFELSQIKRLAHAHSCSINDLLLAVLTDALSQYLNERGEPVRPFRAIMPVNLRSPRARVDETRGNWFGLAFVDLPLSSTSRRERLRLLKRSIDRIKASQQSQAALLLLGVMGRLPSGLQHAMQAIFARKGTIVVSNVVGPRQPLQLAGSRVRDLIFWVPHPSGLACGVSILSYAGRVRVGVRTDQTVVSDPARLARAFEQALHAWQQSSTTADARI